MLTDVRLVDGDREMVLLPRQDDGVFLQKLGAPSPDIRAVAEARTDDDGERDSTLLHGARACSIELLVTEGARAFEDEISRYLHPRNRPYLVVTDDEWAQTRRLRLRSDQFDWPQGVDLPRQMRRVQVQWKCPDGVWEADELAFEDVNADIPSSTGRSYLRSYPRTYATTLSTGASTITSLGALPSHFVARLYGPCQAPRLTNETTGEVVGFTSALTLGPGEYVEIDTRERTAYFLSLTTQSRLGSVDFAATSWWRIEPGDQQVRYSADSASAGAMAVIEYRPAWL